MIQIIIFQFHFLGTVKNSLLLGCYGQKSCVAVGPFFYLALSYSHLLSNESKIVSLLSVNLIVYLQ